MTPAWIDTLPGMVYYVDRNRVCHYANPGLVDWLRSGSSFEVPVPVVDLLGESLYAENLPHIERALAGQPQVFHRVGVGPEEQRRDVLVQYLPDVRDGQVVGYVGLVLPEASTEARPGEVGGTVATDAATSALASVAARQAESERLARAAEVRAKAHALVLTLIASDTPLDDVLHELARQVETDLPGARCAVLGVDPDARCLRVRAAPRLPDRFNAAVDGAAFGPQSCTWGRAVALGERVITTDLRLDPGWSELHELAAEAGLVACVAEPIRASEGSVLGSLVVYHGEPSVPNDGDFGAIEDGSLLAAIAMERALAQRRVRELTMNLERRVHERTSALHEVARELESAKSVADAANVAKSTFLAMVSHEIRTPLSGVLSMVELLERGEVLPHQTEAVALIRHSSQALLRIVDDILDFSKIEAGHLEIQRQATDLHGLVDRLIRSAASSATRSGVDLELDVEGLPPSLVMIDGLRLQQVIGNLVANAVKFASRRGDERGHVRVLVDVPGGDLPELRFCVEDDGIGMSEETVARLFEPFTQADVTITRRYGGVGLGLSICKKLVDLMGGRIAVKSEIGRGTCFEVLLPYQIALRLPSQPPTAFATQLGFMKQARPSADAALFPEREQRAAIEDGRLILVAEDDPTSLIVILQQLRMLGHAAEATHDGAEALAAWRKHRHPLVITDLHMPNLSGYDLARSIRREEGARRATAVLALTADVLRDEARTARDAGMDQYLTKPVQLHVLEAVIDEWLGVRGTRRSVPEQRPPAAPRPVSPSIDHSVLHALIGAEPGVKRDVLNTFLETAASSLDVLDRACSEGDLQALGNVAHRLVGSSRAVGAMALGSASAELARMARGYPPEAPIAPVVDEAARVRRELLLAMDELRAAML